MPGESTPPWFYNSIPRASNYFLFWNWSRKKTSISTSLDPPSVVLVSFVVCCWLIPYVSHPRPALPVTVYY